MFQASRVGLDDAVCAVNGHDGSDSEFCGLLNDPVHLVAFDQGLSKHDRWGLGRRLGVVIDDAGVDGLRGNVGHFYAIADSASVVQAEGISWVQAEAIAKMMKEVTGYADRGGSDGVRVDEERGHNAGVEESVRVMPFYCGKRSASSCVVLGSKKSSTYSSEYASGFFEPAASHLPAALLPRDDGLLGQTPGR